MSGTTVYRNKQKSNSIMLELQKQREQGTFCDVLLEAGGLQYWAHSCVMAAHSKKLGSAVENGKARFGAKGVIKMKLPTSNTLLVEALIKYMYDSHLSITQENVDDMLQLAAKLEMDDIKQCCAVHLCRSLSGNNWSAVKKSGEKFKLEDVLKTVQEYCSKNFCDIVHDFDFLNLEVNLLELIIKGANDNNVPRVELHCLYGILKWTCHDLDQRKHQYENLIALLNPILLSKEKCLALFEEETIKASNLLNDEVTQALFDNVLRAGDEREAQKRPADEIVAEEAFEEEDELEAAKKRSHKKKDRLIPEDEYPKADDNSYICPLCCKTFEKMNSLVGHFRTHNAQWLCSTCGFTADTYYQRLSHLFEKHGGFKYSKFVCEYQGCDFETMDHYDMRKHFEAHGKSSKTGGPIRCDVCKEMFNSKFDLHNHRAEAHKDAVFKCQNCTYESFSQGAFETHLKNNHPDAAVLLGYMTAEEAKSRAVGEAMKTSDIYSRKSASVRTVKECPFCTGFCTLKNDRLINHIKKSHSDISVDQMQEELQKILNKS